jgi:hypothetical protein
LEIKIAYPTIRKGSSYFSIGLVIIEDVSSKIVCDYLS